MAHPNRNGFAPATIVRAFPLSPAGMIRVMVIGMVVVMAVSVIIAMIVFTTMCILWPTMLTAPCATGTGPPARSRGVVCTAFIRMLRQARPGEHHG